MNNKAPPCTDIEAASLSVRTDNETLVNLIGATYVLLYFNNSTKDWLFLFQLDYLKHLRKRADQIADL